MKTNALVCILALTLAPGCEHVLIAPRPPICTDSVAGIEWHYEDESGTRHDCVCRRPSRESSAFPPSWVTLDARKAIGGQDWCPAKYP